MPKLVSVTRILNEDDIAEAFIRHNARHVGHMLFLDNGSSDRTLDILRALQAEGLPLSVVQTHSISFDEVSLNSWGYQAASQLFGADWVVFIDADEFIATQDSAPLTTLLPADAPAITVQLINYGQTELDDPNELIVPLRLRHRWAGETNVDKLILRAGLPGVSIGAGNHCAFLGSGILPARRHDLVSFAHYPRRSGWQILQKMAAGWLKALAAGHPAAEAGHSEHYRSPFETIRDKPGELFRNSGYFTREFGLDQAIEAPLDYLGGTLCHTLPTDPAMKAAQMFLSFTERLAIQHGRLLDESPQARALVETWNAKRDFLF
ncbi:glycosyltransferase family 2 protein [Acidocella aromatica]|uniref:Glycosyltransferase involved in cell wall biosynthesis n=1 Tax=Acidocella aromatica TaxID=1303579 RepID=A0A840V7R9_9PROT|nr:glycosyltransferase family 2 protein [Acidocella aromatica]MBB5371796.1 glycosyltransferase involved in cell wall biosynthesis [Acidocella aromatica]